MRYLNVEGALRSSVWVDLPAYAVADAASQTLLWVIDRAGFEAVEDGEDPPPSYWRAKALLYLGVLGVRTVRAGMAVISNGYEAEAMTYKRALMEVHSRARRVFDDRSGTYAREWLRGRAGKPAKAVGGYSPDDFWSMLSHSSHADHRAVENFLAISQPDGSTTLLTNPERRGRVSNVTLAVFAGEARDVARLLAAEHDIAIPQLAELDAAIASYFPWNEGEGAAGGRTPNLG
jgi:hypothetical protein